MTAILAVATGGCGVVVISEAMLRYWKSHPDESAMKIMLRGLLFRTALVLSALVVVVSNDWFATTTFVAALFASYLAAQVWEGFRYQRYIHSR